MGTLRAMTVGRPLLEYLRRTDGPLFGCGPWRFGPLPVMARRYSSRPDQLIGLADDAEPASQVTRSWQPDHVCDGSPDSIKFGREIGWFRAHDGRGIAKIGHLTLDQEIEGSNPSSPANTTTCWGVDKNPPQHLVE